MASGPQQEASIEGASDTQRDALFFLQRRDERLRARAGDPGLGAVGRQAQSPSAISLETGHDRRVGSGRGRHDRMIGLAGLDHQPAPVPSTACQPGAAGQHSQRLLRGSLAGSQELLVEVQEHHRRRRRQPPQHCLGADHDPLRAERATL